MKPLAEAIAAVGKPMLLHSAGGEPAPKAMVARFCHNGGDFDIAPSDIVRVTINLRDGVRARAETDSVPPRSYIASAGNVSVVPAHQRTRLSVRGKADVLQLYLRESFLDAAVEGQFSCQALLNSDDSELRAAAMQIFVAATRGEPDDSLMLDSGIHRIAAHLLDRTSQGSIQLTRGGLARAARRRVNDMITAALDDKSASPTLDQLADAACLSVNHFIRAFHQQTGVTPHRHVVLRRLERGITLLKKPGMSVAEVADGVGFATPAHFVATFRRTMGVTPGAFQAALLS